MDALIRQAESLSLEGFRRAAVVEAMRRTGGRKILAAELLGVSRATFYRWLDEDVSLADAVMAALADEKARVA